jgi:hypothetical protein
MTSLKQELPMAKVNPQEAADAVRPLLKDDPWPPGDPHRDHYFEAVCAALEVLPIHDNVAHVVALMEKAGVEPDDNWLYPKAHNVKNKHGKLVPAKYPDGHPKAGQDVVFATPEEEAEYQGGHEERIAAIADPVPANVEEEAHDA